MKRFGAKLSISGVLPVCVLSACGRSDPYEARLASWSQTPEIRPENTPLPLVRSPLSEDQVEQLMTKVGFEDETLSVFKCIVEHESRFRPDAIHMNKNGTIDYGLFQINLRWWKNDCGIGDSRELFDPEVNARCALKVFERHGFEGWTVHRRCIPVDDNELLVAAVE